MIWLFIIWGMVALLVFCAYLKPGFKSSNQILKGYSQGEDETGPRAARRGTSGK